MKFVDVKAFPNTTIELAHFNRLKIHGLNGLI
jgi:hypothetical protein